MDLTVLGVICLAIPTGVFIYFCSLIFKFDPYYAVFGDILGDPLYRTTSTVVYANCFLIRALFTSACFEVARSIAFYLTRDLLMLDAIQVSLTAILKESQKTHTAVANCVVNFKSVQIPFTMVANFADEVVPILFSFLFWIFMLGAWVILVGFKFVPTYVYFVFLVLVSGGFPILLCALSVLSGLTETSTQIIRCLVQASHREYAFSRSPTKRQTKLVWTKVTKSLSSIRIRHKPIACIDKEFPRSWFQNWLDTLINLLVLSNV